MCVVWILYHFMGTNDTRTRRLNQVHKAPFLYHFDWMSPSLMPLPSLKNCGNSLSGISLLRQLTHYRPAIPFGNRKKYFRGSSEFSIATIQKIYHPRKTEINYLGISESLQLRITLEKFLSSSHKLNFTPNTSGCYGLSCPVHSSTSG